MGSQIIDRDRFEKGKDCVRNFYAKLSELHGRIKTEDNNKVEILNSILEVLVINEVSMYNNFISSNKSDGIKEYILTLINYNKADSIDFQIHDLSSKVLFVGEENDDTISLVFIVDIQKYDGKKSIIKSDTINHFIVFVNDDISQNKAARICRTEKYKKKELLEIDSDNDGVPDRIDKCPDKFGLALDFGCPKLDIDKDGIPDDLDKCPKIAGVAIKHGCPEVIKNVDLKFNLTVKFIANLNPNENKELLFAHKNKLFDSSSGIVLFNGTELFLADCIPSIYNRVTKDINYVIEIHSIQFNGDKIIELNHRIPLQAAFASPSFNDVDVKFSINLKEEKLLYDYLNSL